MTGGTITARASRKHQIYRECRILLNLLRPALSRVTEDQGRICAAEQAASMPLAHCFKPSLRLRQLFCNSEP